MSRKKPDLGERVELVVVEIVRKFIKERKLFKHKIRVVDYIHSKTTDKANHRGVDLLIIFDTGLSLPLQIKSSVGRKAVFKHLRKHPQIKFVFGVGKLPQDSSDWESYRRISRNLVKIINQALKQHQNGSIP